MFENAYKIQIPGKLQAVKLDTKRNVNMDTVLLKKLYFLTSHKENST